jgi:uncharacterized membrane protein
MISKNFYSVCVLVIVSLFISSSIFAGGPVLSFEKEKEELGTLYLDDLTPGEKQEVDVSFTNTGDAPLILANVRACCGTTVDSWPNEPIMPGKEGVIKVSFRLNHRAQRISRTVTITSNNSENSTSIYKIYGEVVEREDDGFIQHKE